MGSPDTLAADSCLFCDVLVEPSSAFDVRESLADGSISLMPALGMIVPGYFLSVAQQHVTSFAQLARDQLAAIDASQAEIESQLAPLFGSYFRFEHGVAHNKEDKSGTHVDHAHQHLIPADHDAGLHILDQLPWQRLDCYEDIADFSEMSYVYLGLLATNYILPNPDLPSQWARRQVAEVRKLETYDWAVDVGNQQLAETFHRLRATPQGFSTFENHELVTAHLTEYPPNSDINNSSP